MAPLTNEDKILIKTLRIDKGLTALRMIRESPARNWKKRSLCNLIKRIDKKLVGKRGIGRLCSARTAANIQTVGNLVCSQEDRPNTSKSLREISDTDRLKRVKIDFKRCVTDKFSVILRVVNIYAN